MIVSLPHSIPDVPTVICPTKIELPLGNPNPKINIREFHAVVREKVGLLREIAGRSMAQVVTPNS